MSYRLERETVGAVLADWDACPILWPSSEIDPELLEPSPEATEPTRYLVVGIEREGEKRLTAGGTRQIDGAVRIWIWCEARLGDGAVEELADQLALAFAASEPPSRWNWTDFALGEPARDGGFYGAEWTQHFIRFEDSPA